MGMGISVRDFGSQLRSGNAAYVVVWCVLIFQKKTLQLQQRRGLRPPLAHTLARVVGHASARGGVRPP